jgi:S1-C subfamily serine protease
MPHRPTSTAAVVATLATLGLLGPAAGVQVQAQRAPNPVDATVFIRTLGVRQTRSADLRQSETREADVQLATGSGFVVSPLGYVVTNHHVVAANTEARMVNGVAVELTRTPSRIEVVFPTGLPNRLGPTPVLEATVYAADEALDLAVLQIGGADFPYLALGDSEAVAAGDAVTALGFPFGRMVEVVRQGLSDVVPRVSVSRGDISALRADVAGETRYLQTSATLNPGNSGGPMLDADGFVVGVVRMVLTRGRNIGFGIPVSALKTYLRTAGLEQLMPTRPLAPGPAETLPDQRLSLPMPVGFVRTAVGSRLHYQAGALGVELRTDRVVSPWTVEQLQSALVTQRIFEPFAGRPSQADASLGTASQTLAWAAGRHTDTNAETGMVYAVQDLGSEWVVARYVGPIESLAYNKRMLIDSLAALRADPLRTAPIDAPLSGTEWVATPLPAPGAPQVTLPVGRELELDEPWACAGLPRPRMTLAASPPGDFTVQLRFAWWLSGVDAAGAAAACATAGRGELPSSYAAAADRLGMRYEAEGLFFDLGANGVIQVELAAPAATMPFARSLLDGWTDPR